MSKKKLDNYPNYKLVFDYVYNVVEGRINVNKAQVKGCKRFLRMLEDDRYDFNPRPCKKIIGIIEKTLAHRQGEDLEGVPMRGSPFLLQDFHKYIVYAIMGFYFKGTSKRVVREALIHIPRKNVKTTFAAALAWALSLYYRKSGSKCYIASAALKQSLESFDFINWNIEFMGEKDSFRIIDNNQEHSIQKDFGSEGSMFIQALAANPDRQDSLNCNLAICDEIHAFKAPKQYNIIKEAMKAYTNKLMIGISTAGDNVNSFYYRRLQYADKILNGQIENDELFIFKAEADKEPDGSIDFTNPKIHEMANPGYGVTIRPKDMLNDSIEAFNLTGKDLDLVLDSVTKTAQNTGVSTDKLFDSVVKGAPALQGMGLNFSQSVALMGQFEQSGVDSSKAMSYLTKAQANWAKEGKTMEQGLTELTGKIKGAKNEQEAIALATETFGTKAGPMMAKAIKDGKLNFEELAGAANGAKGAVTSTFDETKDPIDEFKVAMNNLKIAGAELGEALQKALGPIIKEVIEKLKGFTKWFSSLSQGQKEFIIKIGLLAAAVGPVVVVFSKLTQGVGGFAIKMAGLSTKITQAGGVMSFLSGGMASLL